MNEFYRCDGGDKPPQPWNEPSKEPKPKDEDYSGDTNPPDRPPH